MPKKRKQKIKTKKRSRWLRIETAPLWLAALFVISSILHNLVSAALGIEEPVFFMIAMLSALAFVVSVIYLIVVLTRRAFKK